MKNNKLGFSLLEISIVLLIMGILISGVYSGNYLMRKLKILDTQSLTLSSPVKNIGNLVLWLEPVLLKSIKKSERYNGEKITQWKNLTNDYSPANIMQTTPGNQPTYNDSGINNLPSITFDANSYFDINSALQNIINKHFSIFIVQKTDNNIGGGNIMIADNSSIVIQYKSPNGFKFEKNGDISIEDTSGFNNKANIHYLSSAKTNHGSAPDGLTYYRNKGVTLPNTITPTTEPVVGNGLNFVGNMNNAELGKGYIGDVSEVIIFNKSLTFIELNKVLNYLSSKYNIKLDK